MTSLIQKCMGLTPRGAQKARNVASTISSGVMKRFSHLQWQCTTHLQNSSKPASRTAMSAVTRTAATSTDSPAKRETQFPDDVIKFMDAVYDVIKQEELLQYDKPGSKVVEFKHPAELRELVDFDIGHDGAPKSDLIRLIRQTMQYSLKTGGLHFYNQLYSGRDPYGLLGAWVTEALNTNLHTFEVAPMFVLSELYMIEKLCNLIGFTDGDGIFCPGASFAIFYALHLARYRWNPLLKKEGLAGGPRFALYTSADAHYALKKAASFTGFGTDSIVFIRIDDKGRLCPEDLENQIRLSKEKGDVPLFVMATSGTTVLGAYDDLNMIADVCERNSVWMHVDGAWGGAVVVSKKYKSRMDGMHRCDSLVWNCHKMFGAPLQCSALLVKEKGLLSQCNTADADYLFQPDKFYDVSYDIGDKSLQCGRKPDAYKLWLMWKAHGDAAMEARIDMAFDNAAYLIDRIRNTDGFQLVIPEFQCTNVCYWYIPPRLRAQEQTAEWWQEINEVAPQIKERMTMCGSMMIGYTPLKSMNCVNFFRIIIANPLSTHEAMDFVISETERLGKDL